MALRLVIADSSFRRPGAMTITHATNGAGGRTLCGRVCTNWQTEDAYGADGPDCLVCARVWKNLMNGAG